MKIAIHHFKNSFSERWLSYCEKNDIPFKLVNCYSSDIIDQLSDCSGLMWHWSQEDPKAKLFARQLTYSIEAMGKKVFPDSSTAWHFDDKVGQKYLLEAVSAPLVPSYVFYSKKEALSWISKTNFPKVFKLRGGAGAINVKLVKSKSKARSLAKKAFGKGFGASGRTALFYNRLWKFRKNGDFSSFIGIFKGLARLFIPSDLEKFHGNEKGYIYFQDFIANNDSDIRIVVIEEKAFAIKRMNRTGDFRASGSGILHYLDNHTIDKRCLLAAFEVAIKLNAQCLAFDFVYNECQVPLIVEISYGFSMLAYDLCPGYWNKDLSWVEGSFNPQHFMIENFINSLKEEDTVSNRK
ncbi:hypothetical protein C900_00160 [Fulvivirga imtechensis AK7]|uniref:ATP-grasp domain-containing protein n=1 Tax=Fulvivirga imtechensis AK7 TaxID=1237149 RepID=L8JM98_9BACT|nr:hypothetical protein [Fulvivirga imtechensis]ELR68649.1 hypothetical protein C900_00160 [Fulvivirga imtechensis AK7]